MKKMTLFFAWFVVSIIVAVMGWHWTDTANEPFWWNFWVWAAVCAIVYVVGFVLYLFSKGGQE